MSNNLWPSEAERLAKLAEECGEVVQVIGKILLHGWDSRHPDGGPTNRELLQMELGDIEAVSVLMETAGDVSRVDIAEARLKKLSKIKRFMHHQGE
jgi:NTP pyrophosphatase (non-canonical NTP hydrolase)